MNLVVVEVGKNIKSVVEKDSWKYSEEK